MLESFQLESEKSTWNLSVIPPGFLQEFHLLVNSSWKIEIPCQFRLESTCNSGGFWLEFSYRIGDRNFGSCCTGEAHANVWGFSFLTTGWQVLTRLKWLMYKDVTEKSSQGCHHYGLLGFVHGLNMTNPT